MKTTLSTIFWVLIGFHSIVLAAGSPTSPNPDVEQDHAKRIGCRYPDTYSIIYKPGAGVLKKIEAKQDSTPEDFPVRKHPGEVFHWVVSEPASAFAYGLSYSEKPDPDDPFGEIKTYRFSVYCKEDGHTEFEEDLGRASSRSSSLLSFQENSLEDLDNVKTRFAFPYKLFSDKKWKIFVGDESSGRSLAWPFGKIISTRIMRDGKILCVVTNKHVYFYRLSRDKPGSLNLSKDMRKYRQNIKITKKGRTGRGVVEWVKEGRYMILTDDRLLNIVFDDGQGPPTPKCTSSVLDKRVGKGLEKTPISVSDAAFGAFLIYDGETKSKKFSFSVFDVDYESGGVAHVQDLSMAIGDQDLGKPVIRAFIKKGTSGKHFNMCLVYHGEGGVPHVSQYDFYYNRSRKEYRAPTQSKDPEAIENQKIQMNKTDFFQIGGANLLLLRTYDEIEKKSGVKIIEIE